MYPRELPVATPGRGLLIRPIDIDGWAGNLDTPECTPPAVAVSTLHTVDSKPCEAVPAEVGVKGRSRASAEASSVRPVPPLSDKA